MCSGPYLNVHEDQLGVRMGSYLYLLQHPARSAVSRGPSESEALTPGVPAILFMYGVNNAGWTHVS